MCDVRHKMTLILTLVRGVELCDTLHEKDFPHRCMTKEELLKNNEYINTIVHTLIHI